ncbi:MAG: T9SS type A sorting domain-containing protein [Labilibaculum antarcticum]
MIKNFTLLFFLFASITLSAQNINIPDANFKKALVDNAAINTDGDREISESEAEAFTGGIDLYGSNISDLTGLEYFVNITELDCSDNQLSSLDVSKNTRLTYLYCSDNQLSSLDISKNSLLINFECSNNQLSNLDLNQNVSMKDINFGDNQISNMDLSMLTELKNLTCKNNQMSSLDISNNGKITLLSCSSNQITSLDLTKQNLLTTIECNNNQLTNLNLSTNTALAYLYCTNNQLSSLDVSNNTELLDLNCSNNELSTLDISKNTKLSYLMCPNNKFTFSELSKIKNYYSSLNYTSTKKIFSPQNGADDFEIDYSSESLFAGNETNFIWYNSADEEIGADMIQKVSSGVYKFLESGIYYCKMDNEILPGTRLTTESITIDKIVNIPDANFKKALVENIEINTNGDEEISEAEAEAFTGYLWLGDLDISDLTGIEYFTNIKSISCYNNNLKSINIDNNTKLTQLICSGNQLSSLNTNNNKLLKQINCYGNKIKTLDLKSNTNLTSLDCAFNDISTLEISTNTEITSIRCAYNNLINLDVSNNTKLESLKCHNNQISTINLKYNKLINSLTCENNNLSDIILDNSIIVDKIICSNNRLPFSILLSLKNQSTVFTCESSKRVFSFIEDKSKFQIDYSKELLSEKEPTIFNWYYNNVKLNDGDNTIKTIGNGIFEFQNEGVFYCKMTNEQFADLTITTERILINDNNKIVAISDQNFKQYLISDSNINLNGDNEIQEAEAISFNGSIIVSNKDISDLTGIESFINLTKLDCSRNNITILNVEQNTELTKLFCFTNNITVLDISKNTKLESLKCFRNELKILNTSLNLKLSSLVCNQNHLSTLDINNNTLYIDCSNNEISSLNLQNNTSLSILNCKSNNLTELDISSNTALTKLECSYNKIPFSELIKIKNILPSTIIKNQYPVFEVREVEVGDIIDYSSEYKFGANTTNFEWTHSIDNVTFSDLPVEVIDNDKFKLLKPGTYNCRMTNPEFPGTQITTENITINKLEQQITFENLQELVFVKDIIDFKAKASSSLTVKQEIISGDAETNNNKITFNQAGIVKLKFTQKGDYEYKPVEKSIDITVIKKEQNINVLYLPSSVKVNDIIELNASASSGLSINLSIVSGDATLDGNTLTVNSAGKVTIKASQSGNFEFLETETTKEIVVEKRSQTFNSIDIPASAKVSDILTLNVTASSNLPVSFEIISGEVTLKEKQLTCTKSGTVKIKAIQTGNYEFEALETTFEIVVSKKTQTISFTSPPSSAKVNDVLSLKANASSTLPVSFEIVSGEASLNGNQLTCTKSGILKVKAKQVGNDEYEAAEATVEIAVSKKDQFITFNDVPSEVEATDQLDLDVTISSGLEVSYIIVKGDASISGNTITFNEVGNVIIKAINSGNDEYNETEQSYLFIVRKKEQDINADNIPSQVTINENLDLNLSASSGLAIDLEIISGTAVLSGTNLNFTEAGEVKVKASQSGNSVYESTETSFTISVIKKDQTLDIQNTSGSVIINETMELIATASSTLPVSFSIILGDAELYGNSITFTSAGDVTIKAKQIGNNEFIAVEQIIEFTVNKKTQTVSFVNTPTTAKVNDEILLTATASSDREVSFEVLEGEANLNSNELICLKSGIVKVKATQAGNDEFETAEAVIEITVEKRDQSIDFINAPTTVKANDVIELNATATSGLEVTFELISGDASIDGHMITFNQEGTVEIKAIQAGNDEYKPAEATIKITVDIATGINDVLKSSIQVYPNPVITDLNISFDKNEDRMIYIYDAKGQIRLQQKSYSNSEQLNISDFKSGMYILKIQSESGAVSYKILKQ